MGKSQMGAAKQTLHTALFVFQFKRVLHLANRKPFGTTVVFKVGNIL